MDPGELTWRMKHFKSESFPEAHGVTTFQVPADRNRPAHHGWDPGCRAFSIIGSTFSIAGASSD